MITDDGCRNVDRRIEKQATFFAGRLLISEHAAQRAAFDGWSNADVAATFEVSAPLAQMGIYGVRVYAERALQRQRRAASRAGPVLRPSRCAVILCRIDQWHAMSISGRVVEQAVATKPSLLASDRMLAAAHGLE